MDFTSIIGLVLGAGLILYGIGFSNLGNFFDAQSIIIVVGGTAAAVIASYPIRMLKNVPLHLKILLQGKKYNPANIIDQLVEMSDTARKNGILALEEKSKEIKDPFFKHGILLVVDAMEQEKVRSILETEVEAMSMRHEDEAGIYEKAAALAPSFGMIGTLVGLVNMLKGLDLAAGGSSNIGQDMSVALITTFYGCVVSNLFMIPVAHKLKVRNDEEVLYKQLIIEGVISIQGGDNPKMLKEKLLTYLDQKQQTRLLEGKGAKKKK